VCVDLNSSRRRQSEIRSVKFVGFGRRTCFLFFLHRCWRQQNDGCFQIELIDILTASFFLRPSPTTPPRSSFLGMSHCVRCAGHQDHSLDVYRPILNFIEETHAFFFFIVPTPPSNAFFRIFCHPQTTIYGVSNSRAIAGKGSCIPVRQITRSCLHDMTLLDQLSFLCPDV